ncbi:hypothetical protein GF386_02710 [Candidatus Pacearchaeota archaeon]|nr:hypothetical protein [Candidatus Pacearchaeota archaeon]MBD3283060.1 hypothetical protein [Candidatus Pacearchaeota archaeon]
MIDFKITNLEKLALEYQRTGDNSVLNEILVARTETRSEIVRSLIRRGRLSVQITPDEAEIDLLYEEPKRIMQWDPEKMPLEVYLRKHAYDSIVDSFRSRTGFRRRGGRFRQLDDMEEGNPEEVFFVSESPDLEDYDSYEHVSSRVGKLLEGFDSRSVQIICLRYGYGMRMREVGVSLGLSESSVSNILGRLNPVLRQRIQEQEIPFSTGVFMRVLRERSGIIPGFLISDYGSRRSNSLRDSYAEFLRARELGFEVPNPLRVLDKNSMPVLRGILAHLVSSGTTKPYRDFVNGGFWCSPVIRGGLTELAERVAPELSHRLRQTEKWKKGERSVDIALRALQDSFFKVKGYEEAEVSGDEYQIADVMNSFLRMSGFLKEFLVENGCSGLLQEFVDPEGIYGLKTGNSPKAAFDFYYSRKYPGLLDRSSYPYLELWRIHVNNRWTSGNLESAVQTALDATQDFLRQLPGYRNAETKSSREVSKVVNAALQKGLVTRRAMEDFGLNAVLIGLKELANQDLLDYSGTGKGLLEFYFQRRFPEVIDRDALDYARLYGIVENRRWSRGEESVISALELSQDFLRTLDGFRRAEDSGDREGQLVVLDRELILRHSNLSAYLLSRETGLGGMMASLYDPSGKRGLAKRNSAEAFLRFYSQGMGHSWFDSTRIPFISSRGGRKGLEVVYEM